MKMRLLELEIQHVRGIQDLDISPQRENFAVWGPNGSGKSAVVDAIDFLLTGEISRLKGKGTKNISLNKHGPHVDHRPEDAIVRGKVQLDEEDEPIDISRCMKKPKQLICKDSDLENLKPALKLAERGHHVLTRREILRYINAEGGTRAKEIQELLNITKIENIRRALVSVRNEFAKDLQSAQELVRRAQGTVCATLNIQEFDPLIVADIINQHRAVFGKAPIKEIQSNEIKSDLVLPVAVTGEQRINVTVFQRDVANLKKAKDPGFQEEITDSDSELRRLINEVKQDPKALRALPLIGLIKLGIELVDETGECPLCETPWPEGKLVERLEGRLAIADIAAQEVSKIESHSNSIIEQAASLLSSLENVIAVLQLIDLKNETVILERWQVELEKLVVALNLVLSKYPLKEFEKERVARLLAPKDIVEHLDRIDEIVTKKFPTATPEQTAWDTLTRLEENLKSLESALELAENCELFFQRAETLKITFEAARDKVLGALYDDVKERFVSIYKSLHEDDEKEFDAEFKPSGAALDFEVDFYGRGTHPPNALHSEGHQDSMGLCLFLALAERLTDNVLDLIILDDVVMSVDADHRRQLCHLLGTAFPKRQFLITTHDRTWATQLKCEGVIRSKSMIEFFNWDIDTGPQVNTEVDFWQRIDKDLKENDLPAASAKLRRGSEEYYSMVCDSLQAPVRFKLDGRWELGDLLPAAISQYRKLIKLAKKSANSWNQKDQLEDLNETNSIASSIFERSNAEQWAVNANVHYNNWTNFTRQDFQPVVEAFQDLYNLFLCSDCGTIFYVTQSGTVLTSMRCHCKKFDWNFIEKN